MSHRVPQAEGIKPLRELEPGPCAAGVSNSGGRPRPIRKRAFYRAFRRRKLWAIVSPKTVAAKRMILERQFARVHVSAYAADGDVLAMWPGVYE